MENEESKIKKEDEISEELNKAETVTEEEIGDTKVENLEEKNEEVAETTSESKETDKLENTENLEVTQNQEKESVENIKISEQENIKEELSDNNKKVTEEKLKEENNDKSEETKGKKKTENGKNKKIIILSVSAVVIIIALMIFSVIFSLININNDKIMKGVSVLGIDVSGLTTEEATQRVTDAINEKFTNENESIVLKRADIETTVTANTFNAKFDVDSSIAEAYNIGRSGNIITNNYAILGTMLFEKNIEPELYYDEEFMTNTIDDISSKMKDSVVEYSYYIEDEDLIVVKGKAGYIIKTEELTQKIIDELKDINSPYTEIEIPVEYKEPEPIDLQKIRDEIYKEPKDAYVEKNPTVVHVEENGVDFEISLEEAQKLLEEDKEEYVIPLKITEPKKKLEDLGEEAFPDQLSTFSTIYDASATNRATNIELATKKINGTVIMPGETFSYNKVVGSRTIEAGWKEGTAYIGGKVVPSVGGGVCQVSSTLYNTALLANLEITERTNHTFTVDYVSPSRDATVYYGSLDFCFKNNRTYPVKIVASAKNGVCKISLYGIKEEVEYEVIIQSKITSYINNTTTYKEDPTLEQGKEVVEQIGFNGCRSEGYKILKLNGKVVSQTLLSKDTYSPQERIVRRGTKKVITTPQETEKSNTNEVSATAN